MPAAPELGGCLGSASSETVRLGWPRFRNAPVLVLVRSGRSPIGPAERQPHELVYVGGL